ncbi:MAG TPA: hypothetical protein VNQ73_09715 [Ilumatobacter sp.]|nr:hypothetical protein [Ilumatobacter sp.]
MFDDLHDPNPPAAAAHHLATVAERAERRRSRRTGTAMLTTTAVLIAVGTTAIALRAPDDAPVSTPSIPPPTETAPAPTTAAPTASTSPSSSAPTTSTLPTPTTSAPTTPDASTATVVSREPSDPTPPELLELAAMISERARIVQSFGGHLMQSQVLADGTEIPTERDVIFAADGSMWATNELGGWAAFDASTGISRLAYRLDADDDLMYQEIVGWNENFTGEQIMLGHSPVLDVTMLHGDITITESASANRPAWRIETRERHEFASEQPVGTLPDDVPTDGVGVNVYMTAGMRDSTWTYWVDQATGITLASEQLQTSTYSDGRTEQQQRSAEFTTFSTDAALPPEFPGTFPPDAEVRREGDPAGFSGEMTEADLVAAFGDGLLVPDVPAAHTYYEFSWMNFDDNGHVIREDGTALGVSFHLNLGFQRVQVGVGRALGGGPGANSSAVGTVAGGALDGAPIYFNEYNGYQLWATVGDANIDVSVSGVPTVDQAAELLGTMRTPAT